MFDAPEVSALERQEVATCVIPLKRELGDREGRFWWLSCDVIGAARKVLTFFFRNGAVEYCGVSSFRCSCCC